jgi:DNA-binding response OmpR family regulator
MKNKILIVEDNGFMKALLKNLFKSNFDVFCTSNGFEALEWMYKGNVPNVILSDLKMPDMDGIELLQNIRGSTFYKNVPLIMLSGAEKSGDRVRCLQLGADDFVLKPFNPEELIIRIDKILKYA